MNNKIKNKALVILNNEGKKHFIESNEVECKEIKVKVLKEQNKSTVFEGEILEYTIKIKNGSDEKLREVEFVDGLDRDAKYVPGSFKLNGMHKTPMFHGNTLTFVIPEICEYEEAVIKFEVKAE